MPQEINLPPAPADITKNGIKEFLWPISFKEISEFGKKLEYALSKYLREYPDQDEILTYKVLIKHYTSDVCGMFQGDLLRQRAEEKNISVNVSLDWLFFPYTMQKKSPSYPYIIDSLKNIKATPSIWKRLQQPKRIIKVLSKVRPFQKKGLSVDGLIMAKPSLKNFENDIIATQRTELIVMHARKVEQSVFLCRSERWFKEIIEQDIENLRDQINLNIMQDIIKIISDLYVNFNIELPPHTKNYLEDFMKEFFAIIKIHRDHLKKSNEIPHTIWTGTSGNIWDMMLRLEVLRRKGVVTAHDHSGDRAHAKNFEMGWIEMYGANYFATYSEKQAESLRKYIWDWPILDKNPPEIISVGEKSQKNSLINSNAQVKPKKVKKIMLFSTVYDRDRGRGNPIFPMISYIDWQARLIGKLNEWGYKVYFKPHPESPLMPPSCFVSDLNVTIINGRFEDMSEDMDLYFFDFTQTSVFKPAILSRKPFVIVDFKGLDWVEGSRQLLEKRAEIIEGEFDKENRVQVNWGNIKNSILEACKKTDNVEFVEEYYF